MSRSMSAIAGITSPRRRGRVVWGVVLTGSTVGQGQGRATDCTENRAWISVRLCRFS